MLEKEKLGAMQAHLAGKMPSPKAPSAVSHPRPTGGTDCRGAGEGPLQGALDLSLHPGPGISRAPVPPGPHMPRPGNLSLSNYKPSDLKIPKHRDPKFAKQ